jgi:biotin transport system substrate-specific component
VSTIAHPIVFSDVLPKVKARTIVLVVGFALLTALLAQVKIHLGWTPVPITGQTFAALLAGATLGSQLGAGSMLLYLLLGLFLPFYSGGEQGWSWLSGANGGYLIGMVAAAFLVGKLAERSQDRTMLTAVPAMLFGSAVIYAIGVPWLAHVADMGAGEAIAKGLEPFVVGDAIKSLVAGAILPTAWMLTTRDN